MANIDLTEALKAVNQTLHLRALALRAERQKKMLKQYIHIIDDNNGKKLVRINALLK